MEERILEATLGQMRPLRIEDAAAIQRLASAIEIAENTFVPHPYALQDARDFVERARENWLGEQGYTFAIIESGGGRFAGVMGLHPQPTHNFASVGYWIGKPYWGRGLATSALRRLIAFGFDELLLNRIEAGHFPQNPASGRVMRKAGMQYEGLRRQAVLHHESYKDIVCYAILRDDFVSGRAPSATTK